MIGSLFAGEWGKATLERNNHTLHNTFRNVIIFCIDTEKIQVKEDQTDILKNKEKNNLLGATHFGKYQ